MHRTLAMHTKMSETVRNSRSRPGSRRTQLRIAVGMPNVNSYARSAGQSSIADVASRAVAPSTRAVMIPVNTFKPTMEKRVIVVCATAATPRVEAKSKRPKRGVTVQALTAADTRSKEAC